MPNSTINTRRRIQTRKTGFHGKGVFALSDIQKDEIIIEYVGEVITWKEALKHHPHDPNDPDHNFNLYIDKNMSLMCFMAVTPLGVLRRKRILAPLKNEIFLTN